MLAAARFKDRKPPTVDGLVLLAAPADVLEATATYLRERGLPGRLMVRLFRPSWRLRIGEPYRRLIPERRIAEIDAPVLVVQPEHDVRVSLGQARRLARAAGTEPTVVEGTGHKDVLESPETTRLVLDFLDRVSRGS